MPAQVDIDETGSRRRGALAEHRDIQQLFHAGTAGTGGLTALRPPGAVHRIQHDVTQPGPVGAGLGERLPQEPGRLAVDQGELLCSRERLGLDEQVVDVGAQRQGDIGAVHAAAALIDQQPPQRHVLIPRPHLIHAISVRDDAVIGRDPTARPPESCRGVGTARMLVLVVASADRGSTLTGP